VEVSLFLTETDKEELKCTKKPSRPKATFRARSSSKRMTYKCVKTSILAFLKFSF
jgi:hypothetical protein